MKKLWITYAIVGLSLSACGENSAIKPQPAAVTLSASQIAQDAIAAGFDSLNLIESTALQIAMQGKITTADLHNVNTDVKQAQQYLNVAITLLQKDPAGAQASIDKAAAIIAEDQNLLNLNK